MTCDHTLVVEAIDSGFFSNFNCVVNHLHHSLGHNGCRAIGVDWRANRDFREFAYGKPEDGNLWEHFFEPLAFPERPFKEIRVNAYADASMTGRDAYTMYRSDKDWRAAYHRVFTKHVRVREEIATRVDEIAAERLDGAFCVGVHYRHPAHNEGPRPAPPFLKHAQWAGRLLPRDRESRVVLATDIHECVDHFRDVFGERLVVQGGVARVPLAEEQQVHYLHAREDPRTSLGKEVLVDALLLARCAVLIHTVSNIATAVGYMRPDANMLFCEPLGESCSELSE